MSGILPERVRHRSTKAEFSCQFLDYFRLKERQCNFNRRKIASTGWIDTRVARQMLAALHDYHDLGADRLAYPYFHWPLWYAFALDCWLTETTEGG